MFLGCSQDLEKHRLLSSELKSNHFKLLTVSDKESIPLFYVCGYDIH